MWRKLARQTQLGNRGFDGKKGTTFSEFSQVW
jgi:hypothetical protein